MERMVSQKTRSVASVPADTVKLLEWRCAHLTCNRAAAIDAGACRPAWLQALVQAASDDDDSSDGEWVAASEDEAAADADDTGQRLGFNGDDRGMLPLCHPRAWHGSSLSGRRLSTHPGRYSMHSMHGHHALMQTSG